MNYSFLIAIKNQLKSSYSFILVFFLCCEIFFPITGWAQSFQDTGSFTFTGSHNPLRSPILREFLPGDGLKVGRAQIHPFLGVAEVFTDNVFATNTQRRSDFLTTIAPGIQAYLPFGGQHSFLLDYRAAQFLYAKFNENNVFTQHGAGHLTLKFPGGLKFNFQGESVDGFDGRGDALDIQATDITKWRATTFSGKARMKGSRGGIRVSTRYTRWHFKNNGQDTSRDRKNINAAITGFAVATKSISGLLGANISNNTYDENKQLDNFAYGVFTGFELAPSQRLSGEVTVGYSILNFDRAPIPPDLANPPDPNNQATQLLTQGLNLGGKQQRRITIEGDVYWYPTSNFSLTMSPYRRIGQSGAFDTSTFIQTGVSLSASQVLRRRLILLGSFYYSNDDFSQGREDNRFSWLAGLDYRTVKWLGFRFAYIFAKRYSSEKVFDTHSNTVSVSVQVFL